MLVKPSADGSRPGYNGPKVKPPTKKQIEVAEKVHGNKYNKKGIDLWESLKQYERSNIRQGQVTGEAGGVGKLKKNQIGKDDFINLVNANKDKTYNQFVELLKEYKTKDNKPFTKNIVADRLRQYGLSGSFKKEPPKGPDNIKKAETEKKRQLNLKDTDPTKAKGTKKFQYHHIRQIAGGVPLTTDDVVIINQRLNAQLQDYDKSLNRIAEAIQKNNKLALEAMNAKNEGAALDYMKRVDELNESAEKIVNSAINKLPKKYKNYVGFNQFTLPTNEYGLPISNEPMIIRKVGGMPVSKDAVDLTTLNLKDEKNFRKIVKAQAEKERTGRIKFKGQKGFITPELLFAPYKGASKVIRTLTKYVGAPDALFGYLDYQNELSKGKTEEEALNQALTNSSLGLYKNKEYMNQLKNVAGSMGVDTKGFDSAYKINLLQQDYAKNNARFEKNMEVLYQTGRTKEADALRKNFNNYIGDLNNQYEALTKDLSQRVVGGSPQIMSRAEDIITEEQFQKPFVDMQNVALEKLKREKIKASPIQKRQVDTTAGKIGEDFYQAFDSLTQGAKNVLQGRIIPFASKIGLPQYEPQQSQREILSDTLQNLSNRDLERFNLGRGYVQSQPVTDQDILNLQYSQPGVFYSEGGVASGPPPEKGPQPQGLSYLMKRGIKT